MARRNESAIQRSLIKWFALAHRGLGIPDARLLFAIPNGGKRDAITAARLKEEGVRPGVPDLFLSMPRTTESGRVQHGLYIEMKTWEGHPTAHQHEVMALLRAQGYEVAVARGVEQAMRVIQDYCTGKEVAL